MTRRNISTIIVEPNAIFREGLAQILNAASHFEIVAATAKLDVATLNSVRSSELHLLVIGVGDCPSESATQIEQFKAVANVGAVAALSDLLDQQWMLALLKAGARACLPKDITSDSLIQSLEVVAMGGTILPPGVLPLLFDCDHVEQKFLIENKPCVTTYEERRDDLDTIEEPVAMNGAEFPHLSAQEKRILRYLIDGASNKAIARKVDIAEATVKVHVKAILRKVRLQNRTQAAVWALNNGPSIFSTEGAGDVDRDRTPHQAHARLQPQPLPMPHEIGLTSQSIKVGGELKPYLHGVTR